MSLNAYRAGLRSAIRGYWSGVLDANQFFDEMRTIINRRLNEAWDQGAKEFGIMPADYTPEEQLALGQAIQQELGFINGLALVVDQNSKANGGKLRTVIGRADLWVNRYLDLQNRAKTMTGANEKLEWRMNPAKENCRTCSALHGKVKRADYWERSGVRPQSPPNGRLECRGWRCGCSKQRTDKTISRGPLPA